MAGTAKKETKKEAKKNSFWKSVKTEFNKITWPDKTETVKQSVAVLCVSVVLGLLITFLDYIIQFGINFLTSIGM
jgi:preprotein translocase subunit SecE